MPDDYSKALQELSKYEVRKATGHGARRSQAFGIFLKETSIRCATFAPVGMGLMRALDVLARGKRRVRRTKKVEAANDEASPAQA